MHTQCRMSLLPCCRITNLITLHAPSAGSGVYPTEAACCTAKGPGPLIAAPGAFEQGCGNVTKAAEPCWVVDTYFPTRQCRQSRTLCGAGEISFLSIFIRCLWLQGWGNHAMPLPGWATLQSHPSHVYTFFADQWCSCHLLCIHIGCDAISCGWGCAHFVSRGRYVS
jgi:hypothetical protein